MHVSKVEKSIGIETYATHSLGIGGVIKQNIEDFNVEEVLVDGSKAQIDRPRSYPRKSVLGSSSTENRHLLCVLVKRNWDTFLAIRNIASQLGINPTRIQIAGIKDAKAVTAQHITIEKVSPEDVNRLQLKDIELRSTGYVRNGLSPYYLRGNNFCIRIRNIKHSETTVEKRVAETVQELDEIGGIPNFFGHQRFGTARPITHLVGRALVKGSPQKAAMLFLTKPSPYEHPSSRQARQELRTTRDFKQALASFPKQLRYERLMLKSLIENPDNSVQAFKRLPAKLRELFVQAYQSYLFNRFLSTRIKKDLSPRTVEIGDFAVNVDRSGLPMPAMYKVAASENMAEIRDEIGRGKMRLAIPLIGFKQRPSQGAQGEIEHEILEEEGVSMQNFRIATMPEMSSRGELRPALAPVKEFSVRSTQNYKEAKRRISVTVGFTLQRGAYATVVLRELMKTRRPVKAGF